MLGKFLGKEFNRTFWKYVILTINKDVGYRFDGCLSNRRMRKMAVLRNQRLKFWSFLNLQCAHYNRSIVKILYDKKLQEIVFPAVISFYFLSSFSLRNMVFSKTITHTTLRQTEILHWIWYYSHTTLRQTEILHWIWYYSHTTLRQTEILH